ncbi:MAG TPA: chemotaxis protein CheB [Mycobacteriales bacterium]|nr:chemotaxis protein CheB [Mycobacteriales bacterium]
MPNRDLVVVGASAGGVEALRDLVRDLPADLPAAVLVVLHLPSAAFSALPAILGRAGKLPSFQAEDGMPLRKGAIYVAPPDHHLLVRGETMALGRGPKENGHRPAIDVLFRSAARWHGAQTVGVILSGSLDDGAAGLLSIVEHGGAAVVQDPESALYDGMPFAALQAVPQALQAAGVHLAQLVVRLCEESPSDDPARVDPEIRMETDIAELDEEALSAGDRPGVPAAMTCPDCNGAMFRIEEGNLVRFRCRVGHAWSPETLLAEQFELAETALWAAIRTMEEKRALHRDLAQRAGATGHSERSRNYHLERAAEAEATAAVLRDLLRRALAGGGGLAAEEEASG